MFGIFGRKALRYGKPIYQPSANQCFLPSQYCEAKKMKSRERDSKELTRLSISNMYNHLMTYRRHMEQGVHCKFIFASNSINVVPFYEKNIQTINKKPGNNYGLHK